MYAKSAALAKHSHPRGPARGPRLWLIGWVSLCIAWPAMRAMMIEYAKNVVTAHAPKKIVDVSAQHHLHQLQAGSAEMACTLVLSVCGALPKEATAKSNCISSQHSTFPAVVARTGIDPCQVPRVHAMQQAASLVQDGAQLAWDAGAEVEDPQEPGPAIPQLAPCTHARTFSPHVLVWGSHQRCLRWCPTVTGNPGRFTWLALSNRPAGRCHHQSSSGSTLRGGLTNSVCGNEQGEGAVNRLQGPEAVLLSGSAWDKSLVRGIHLLSACLCCQRIAA